MKETIKLFFASIGWTIWMLILVAIVAVAAFFAWKYVYPMTLAVRREAVEQSKSFTDSYNIALTNYIHEYTALETDKIKVKDDKQAVEVYSQQQAAILLQMCRMTSTMKADTIAPDSILFIAQHGGCR